VTQPVTRWPRRGSGEDWTAQIWTVQHRSSPRSGAAPIRWAQHGS
jgi:hypothetical protein